MATVAGLPYDPEDALGHFRSTDPILAGLTAEIGEFRLKFRTESTPFEALLRSIVYQQLSGRAAGSILTRVLGLYGDAFPTPAELLDTAEETLRSCGLSQAKTRAVKDLAEKTGQGALPAPDAIAGMSSAEIIKAFTAVRGIGPWTVEMLLIFNLGHPDILPATDLGVRRGFSVAYQRTVLPEPDELLKHGERWKPYRSVASWYLWQAADPKFRAAPDDSQD